MCVEWDHTQVKGQPHWEKAGASQKRAGPPGQRALEEKDEVFIVLFDYSGESGNYEKGDTSMSAMRVVVATKLLLPGQQTGTAVIWMVDGCCTSVQIINHHL